MEQTPTPAIRRPIPLVPAVIAVGLVIVCISAWQLFGQPLSSWLLLFLTLTVVADLLALRVPSMPISFSISDTFSIAAGLLIGPAAGAVTAALDGLLLSFGMKSSTRTPRRVLYNVAAPAAAIWAASQVLFASGPAVLIEGPWRIPRLLVLLVLFGAVNFTLGTGLVAAAVGLETRTSPLVVWREHCVGLWVTYLGGTMASMFMLVLSHDWAGQPLHMAEVLLLIVPLPVMLYMNHHHAVGRAQDQIEHLGGMNRVYMATIEALAHTIDAKDQVTHDHIRRVQENSVRLARALGVKDDAEIQALKAAALLHDVGKISVPDHILNKPGRLTPTELEIMRRHAPAGAEILSVIGFPYPVVPIVRHHHENWDGTGYPDRLAGEAIPIGARILMVVDCFDALTSDRPYRPRFETPAALRVIVDRRGTMYDPRVVDAFLELHAAGLNEAAPETRAPVADPHSAPITTAPSDNASEGAPRELAAFYLLGRELGSPGDVHDVGHAIWTSLRDQLGAAACVLFVQDDGSDSLVPAFRAGAETVAADTRIARGERLSGWVAATTTSILNSDARLDLDPEVRDASMLQSALAVPISDGERTGGVLTFYADRPGAFTTSHQRTAEAVAALIAARVCATHFAMQPVAVV